MTKFVSQTSLISFYNPEIAVFPKDHIIPPVILFIAYVQETELLKINYNFMANNCVSKGCEEKYVFPLIPNWQIVKLGLTFFFNKGITYILHKKK